LGHCIFVIHNITNYIGWNILEKKRIYLRQYTIYLFHANNLIPPKIRNLTSKFWAYIIKTKLHAGRMQSTKETELSKLNHNIVILNTDQLTFALHTSTNDSITTKLKCRFNLCKPLLQCHMNQESVNTFSIQNKFWPTKFYLVMSLWTTWYLVT